MLRITTTRISLLAIVALLAARVAGAQELSLVVNPRTGEVEIQNNSGSAINIDGYLLTATQPRFNPANWNSLAGDSVPGWSAGHTANNRLSEVNLGSFLPVAGGGTIDLGTPYLPFSPTEIGQLEPSFKFEYHVNGGGTVLGDIVFTPQNNLVLVVDPIDGSAALQNQSNFPVAIDGYLIKSTANALAPSGWTSFKNSGAAGPGWSESFAATNRLGEVMLSNSKLLPANGVPMPIGSPINPSVLDDVDDLVLEFHIAGGGTVRGGILLAASASATLGGDYNNDGFVNAADYTVWRNHVGQAFELTNENPAAATPGFVDQEDYLFWKSRYGTSLPGAGAGSGGIAAPNVVPEPATALCGMMAVLCVAAGGAGRRRRCQTAWSYLGSTHCTPR